MDAEEERKQAAAKAMASFDRGCLLVFLTFAAVVAVFAIVVAVSVGGSDNDEPSGDACTRAFIGDLELGTRCYQLVRAGVSPPDAVVIVRNTARDYGRP